ncbi:Helicase, superfamily 1/2, ATP-binding domain-containing protein [Paramicrosporidium saccamoebae]|uniref:Helicase, superfamily 1/2, ATP-binding domain-containing protein n=1 Tax=Paramicrosporidium saccamoebae TaxID=1246581 RepID=A0A2H9THM7_9FUNG|nr:Helicase, superfamily 1/2, ATP-binding domain-containing protein [Paramicrosporidium saccamoebae]
MEEHLKKRFSDCTYDEATVDVLPIIPGKDIEMIWNEKLNDWPPYKSTESCMVLEPLFDLLTGELYDFNVEVADEKVVKEEDGFLTVPPGLPRGMMFEKPVGFRDHVITSLAKTIGEKLALEGAGEEIGEETSSNVEGTPSAVDELLPTVTELFTRTKRPKTEGMWAYALNASHVPLDYESVVAEPAFSFPFELDAFQKQAVYHLERGESVFVAAHTSAGKTVVAEYAIALARRHMTKAIYTSPIKALSNQKFRDFRETFDEVGLLTGDVQINAEASCVIMTTEILRSMLYRGADMISDVEFVIFDEVHYVNDQERGVVWEEVIIMLPPHVTIIMLSATIPNTLEFADWVGRTRKKEIFVISTLKRPVPLEHYLYVDKGEVVKVVDQTRTFLEPGYKKALQVQKGDKKLASGASHGGLNRGFKQEKNLWTDIVYMLKKKTLLPAVMFTFSKRKCEENADGIINLDLHSASEKSAVHVFLEGSVNKLKAEDRTLPQISRMREMLSRGIAVHHSGLLPIIKEAVEILFSRGLVKVLFATETFAMGVNMPARTVVFSSIRKHDGTGFRTLLPGEYTQMAGRAGRRGLDETGTVIITCPEEVPGEATLRTMILGQPTKLTSQFRLTYSMLLNLLRVEALRVEEMIKRSFSENTNQRELPQDEKQLAESEKLLEKAENLNCRICEADMSEFYSTSMTILDNGRFIFEKMLMDVKMSNRLAEPGRIIVVNNGLLRNIPVVVLRLIPTRNGLSLSCLALWNETCMGELLPLPTNMITWPDTARPLQRDTFQFGPCEMVMITSSKIKVPSDLGNTSQYRAKDLDEIQDYFMEWLKQGKSRELEELEIPHFKSIDVDERKLIRSELLKTLPLFSCRKCPELMDHYEIYHRRRLLTERLAELQFRLSDNSLALLPEYHARLALLKTLGYVDQAGNVQLKGRVACELNTVDELITTELLFDNAFSALQPAEIVALLSAMVFQDRHASEPKLGGALLDGYTRLQTMAIRLSTQQMEHGLPGGLVEKLRPGLIEVVYQWALGIRFTAITELTDVLEGSIVRCIVRLDETCREIRGAARIMGDTLLYKKMEEASMLIKRDICFASSLYI